MIELGALLGWFAPAPRWGKAADRRRLSAGRVRCGLRAVEGRVGNIGTEWSGGIAELADGILRFTPEVGIVGDRVIAIQGARDAHLAAHELPNLASDDASVIILDTPTGPLYWAVPAHIAAQCRARVLPGR